MNTYIKKIFRKWVFSSPPQQTGVICTFIDSLFREYLRIQLYLRVHSAEMNLHNDIAEQFLIKTHTISSFVALSFCSDNIV